MHSIIKDRLKKIEQGIVPEGYKKTKVGIVPEDWEVKKLGELGEFLRGKGIPKSEIGNSGVDCIIYGQIYTIYNYFTKELYSKVDNEVADNSIDIEYGDLLFTSSGETREDIGKCVMYLGKKRAVAGGDIVIMRPKDIIKNKTYSYLLNSEAINKQKYKLGQGHSVVHLYSSHLDSIKTPLIPLQEQEKIADILSTRDKAIETIEKLIKEKEIQKKGLMQQLLTRETRLAEFTGEWKEVKLGEMDVFISDGNYGELYPRADEFIEEGVPFLRGNNIYKGKLINNDLRFISPEKHKILKSGHLLKDDILITTRGDIGNVAIVTEEFEGSNINAQICLIRMNKKNLINGVFVYYYFISDNVQKQIKQLQTGSALKQLPKGNLKEIKLNLPPLAEQKAIAEILFATDKEIELLNKLLANKKEEKKGLMQLLLTGIVRV